MKTDDVLKVIDHLSGKLGVTSDKILDAYKGEAKVFVTSFWIYNILAVVLLLVGGFMLKTGIASGEAVENYFNAVKTHFDGSGVALMVIGGLILFIGLVVVINQICEIRNYLEARYAPDTWAITSLMNKLF